MDSNISCVIYIDMPMKRLSKKKDSAYKDELDPEPASEFSSDERGDEEVAEAEVLNFINDYNNHEYGGKTDSPPSKKKRCGINRSEKGGDFNEALIFFLRDINSKSRKEDLNLKAQN